MVVYIQVFTNRKGRVLAGKGSHVVDKGVLSQESLMGVEMRDEDLAKRGTCEARWNDASNDTGFVFCLHQPNVLCRLWLALA